MDLKKIILRKYHTLENFKYNNTRRTTLELKENCIKYISKRISLL